MNGYNGTAYEVENFEGKGFLDVAFTQEEQAKILETTVDNSAETTYSPLNQYACENTNDKIYLMSESEMKKTDYGYKNDQDRMRKGTDYAIARRLCVNSISKNGDYWTRSPTSVYSSGASYVYDDGSLSSNGVDYDYFGVLPALKIFK